MFKPDEYTLRVLREPPAKVFGDTWWTRWFWPLISIPVIISWAGIILTFFVRGTGLTIVTVGAGLAGVWLTIMGWLVRRRAATLRQAGHD